MRPCEFRRHKSRVACDDRWRLKAFRRALAQHVSILLATTLIVAGSALVASSSPAVFGQATTTPEHSRSAQAEAGPASSPNPSASPVPVALPDVEADRAVTFESSMPVVPVTSFWSKAEGLKRAVVKRALATGELMGYRRVGVETRVAEVGNYEHQAGAEGPAEARHRSHVVGQDLPRLDRRTRCWAKRWR